MDLYTIWANKEGDITDLDFVENMRGFLQHLVDEGKMLSFRITRCKMGFRSVADMPEWFIRPTLEQQYPHRLNRIALSDIGIGADSAPPRTKPKYVAGDIISPDTAGLDNLAIIISYNLKTDQYETDAVRTASTGGWIRTGKTVLERRVFVERDHPVKMRTVDTDRVQIA